MGFALSKMEVRADSFDQGGAIPKRHTQEGDDVSPALAWSGAPEDAKAFAVICHDPDAPLVNPGSYGFVHWVLYNLPGSTTTLDEATSAGTQGVNDGGKKGYAGPMPPEGHGVHRYYFWVLALDRELDLGPGMTLWELLDRVAPHVLGMNRIVGTYER
ncbi:MAG TPA: YbhB/YbcL family Raf kinase inhibitor-like protein [Spirochaetia bacterium]|nr:YbhB/YbcL family Raf kinase inhibitor-like protein [Spirochaetia bacterium]